MRKLLFVCAGLVALAVTGLAVAHGIDGAKSVKSVAGTFTATTAAGSQTKTCTTTDGKTIVVSQGKYTGLAAGDPDLTGPIKVDARSVINMTDGVGTVEGRFAIDVASGEDTVAHFAAVYDHGKLAGLATGHAHDPHVKLVANVSAGFSTAGFTDGKIGNTTGGSAVELGPGKCAPQPESKPEKSEATGTITTLTSSSITVASLTCALPPNMAAQVNSAFKQGDRAEIHCAVSNGQNTLVKIEKKR